MALTPQGVPSEPGLTYVNVARSLPFQYTFRGDDFTEFSPATRDLFENRDRELELKLIDIGGSIPVGGVTMFGGLSAAIPYNYLPCDGRSLNTTEFADLFNVIGYRYGGSGTSFLLPATVQARPPVAVDNDATNPSVLVQTGFGTQSTGHVHTFSSAASTGHSHTFNDNGNTASSGHTHTLGASTGLGGVDHFHGGTTGNASANHGHSGNTGINSAGHSHTYTKPNSGTANTPTGGVSVNHTHAFNADGGGAAHTHDFITGLSSGYSHAHNAAANVNATNADTGHTHTAQTILSSNTDASHNHAVNATTADTAHYHGFYGTGFYFIIRYQ